jgi:hypothetical protein
MSSNRASPGTAAPGWRSRRRWPGPGPCRCSAGARRADVDAAAAQLALRRRHVVRRADAAVLAAAAEADGVAAHLLRAHPDAQAAEDAVLVFLPEPLLPDVVLGGQVLDHLGLGARRQQQLQHHPPRPHHPGGRGAHHQPLLRRGRCRRRPARSRAPRRSPPRRAGRRRTATARPCGRAWGREAVEPAPPPGAWCPARTGPPARSAQA